MAKSADYTSIKYLDLDYDFCIVVEECDTFWAAHNLIKKLEQEKPHGDGIYFLSNDEY